jgi:hypothetical protein
LVYFGRITTWLPLGTARQAEAPDWFDVYKCLECIMNKFGPTETAFLKLNWAPKKNIELLKRTANWARHARRKNARPPTPMEFTAARTLLGQILRRALSELNQFGP